MSKKFKALLIVLSMLIVMAIVAGCANNSKAGKSGESKIESISTQDLKDKIGENSWVIVDTRVNDAFNGWKLDGVSRGGHIKGAIDFSANWLKVDAKDKDKKLQQVLKSKGIESGKNVVLYDANGKDAQEVANFLAQKGFKKVYKYDVKEWTADKDLPLESYPNYQMIVPASWINDTIKNNDSKTYKIFEVSWGKESKDYIKGHIPGAVHLNTDEVEEAPIWNRLSDDRLEKFAVNFGITTDTKVILYGADPMAAYRVAAIMKYMGVKDVRVLNGGYAAWTNAGFEEETKVNEKTSVASFGAKVPVNKNYIVDMPEAKKILADKTGSVLVDIRSWAEFTGKTSGYDYIKPMGRPAGSVWGHAGSDPSNLEDFRNIDNTMRNASEITKMWDKSGITSDKRLSFYCGTGWRAAEVLIYADVMGYKNISLYDGGWNEWSYKPGNPIETGDPK